MVEWLQNGPLSSSQQRPESNLWLVREWAQFEGSNGRSTLTARAQVFPFAWYHCSTYYKVYSALYTQPVLKFIAIHICIPFHKLLSSFLRLSLVVELA